jgi:hypothetical protein
MHSKYLKFFNTRPLLNIVLIALAVRLVAVVFAKGYGMHDDHFLVIEASQSWVDGFDYNNWLPKNQENPIPTGHSFFYVGIHYLIFSFCKLIGFTNPDSKMYFIRLLHALLSLVVVVYGYKITEKISNKKNAIQVGLLLALLWFMPFFSVRNLVEVVAAPILMYAVWLLIIADSKKNPLRQYLIAGLIMGIAFSVRFQTILVCGGAGLVLLFQKKWKEAVIFGLGALFTMALVQGVVDMFIWHRPFAELTEYFRYNLASKDAYGTRNSLMYVELVPGLLIPPVGIFLFLGFLMCWRKYPILFVPTIIFFLFHTFFPNKQERFIFSVLPFIILLGVIGWNNFAEYSKFWLNRPKLLKACYTFFWVVNIFLLCIVSTAYSKKSRVEAMKYLSGDKNLTSIAVEEAGGKRAVMMPSYYIGKWIKVYLVKPYNASDTVQQKIDLSKTGVFIPVKSLHYFNLVPENENPDYILFHGSKDLEQRVLKAREVFPELQFETEIKPGYVDRIMLWLNPANRNQPIYIYRTNR